MIELHERLSESSYGYGVTREAEDLLSGLGIKTVPFLPSLIQEKGLGFDVRFDKPGLALLLQFKLGQSVERFVRTDKRFPAPAVQRPFFRFSIDTAEPDGQFETLLKAEMDGAEAYYVAPRFADWPQYADLFEKKEVLNQSIVISPTSIRQALVAKSSPDGIHRIVYDRSSVHVCSEPSEIEEMRLGLIENKIRERLSSDERRLGDAVWHVYEGLESRSEIRRHQLREASAFLSHKGSSRTPDDRRRAQRNERLNRLKEEARSPEDAVGAALGLELWALGIQLLLVSNSDD